MYSEGQTASALNKPSTLTDSVSQLCSRLDGVLNRCSQIGDTLYGSEPRDAGSPIPPSPSAPAVTRMLEAAHHFVTKIENELARVQNKL